MDITVACESPVPQEAGGTTKESEYEVRASCLARVRVLVLVVLEVAAVVRWHPAFASPFRKKLVQLCDEYPLGVEGTDRDLRDLTGEFCRLAP